MSRFGEATFICGAGAALGSSDRQICRFAFLESVPAFFFSFPLPPPSRDKTRGPALKFPPLQILLKGVKTEIYLPPPPRQETRAEVFETIPQKVVLVFGRFVFFFNAQTFSCKTFHPEAAPWGLPNLTVLLPEGVQRRRTSLCV